MNTFENYFKHYGKIKKIKSNISDIKIYDLKTADRTFANCVDKINFSWKLKDEKNISQFQTAYELILIDEDENLVWTSGKCKSDKNVNVEYTGKRLRNACKYYWQVAIWDKYEKVAISNVAEFMTCLPKNNPFGKAKFIGYESPVVKKQSNILPAYTIDYDVIWNQYDLGFTFSVTDTNNLVMLQLNSRKKQGRIFAILKEMKNSKWHTLGEKDVTSKINKYFLPKKIFGCNFKLRLLVKNNSVVVSINKNANKTFFELIKFSKIKTYPLKKLGLWFDLTDPNYDVDDEDFNRSFAGYINQITAKDSKGKVVYENKFNSKDIGFIKQTSTCIEKGMLRVGQMSTGGTIENIIQKEKTSQLIVCRKTFKPKNKIKSAKLFITSLGLNDTYINGKRICSDVKGSKNISLELEPGFTEGGKRLYYTGYDVTSLVKNSVENVISIDLASGWWSGLVNRNFGANEAVMAKVIITYTNGRKEIIDTDSTWKCDRKSQTTFADIFDGQHFDANISDAYRFNNYDDSKWQNAIYVNEYKGNVEPKPGAEIFVRKDLVRKAKTLTIYNGVKNSSKESFGNIKVVTKKTFSNNKYSFKLKKGQHAVIDFGQNASGWENFIVKGKCGCNITIEHAEMLNDSGFKNRGNDGPGGSIYNINYRGAKAVTKYKLKGDGFESWHPNLTFYGFRYVEIYSSDDVEFKHIEAQTISSVFQDTGDFKTNNKDINKLISNFKWGMYSNYISVPTDCPQRDERQGWTADTQVFAETGQFLSFTKTFMEKFLQDMRDAQNKAGAYPGICPTGMYSGADWGGTGWADCGIILPYLLYEMYNDKQIIMNHWNSMEAYVKKFLGNSNNHGPRNVWGDWLAFESNDEEIRDMLAAMYYVWDARLMAKMARIINKSAHAKYYEKIAKKQKEYFINNYVLPNGSLKRHEQSVCAHALYLDCLPDKKSYDSVSIQLVTNIKANGNRLQTGFLGTKVLLDTLTKIGEVELAYKLLLQTENPSWLYSVYQGATTVWERWNSYTISDGFGPVTMNSFNHYAYGCAGAWMFRTIAGINLDSKNPAFKNIILRPMPSIQLNNISAKYNSINGMIEVKSKISNKTWLYDFEIPANANAVLEIPKMQFTKYIINGKKYKNLKLASDGIQLINENKIMLQFKLTNGKYQCKFSK